MNKIDWGSAPKWADWFAVDADGTAMFYLHRPLPEPGYDHWSRNNGAYAFAWAGHPPADWTLSPRRRSSDMWVALETSPTGELPETSLESYASDPSQEHRFTWWEPSSSDYGQWRKTREEALSEAKENYHQFRGKMADRAVYVVECVLVASAPPHAEDAGRNEQ